MVNTDKKSVYGKLEKKGEDFVIHWYMLCNEAVPTTVVILYQMRV